MSAKQLRGLGKGFDALMPEGISSTVLNENKERVQNLLISDIIPNPDQPRRTFDQQALQELADSIKQFGVMQPILVVRREGKFVIIAGERRWRASKLAALSTVPAIVRSVKELEHLEMALVENIQRVDLAPLEQAASIERLHQIFGLSFEQIAKRLNKAPSTIVNSVRLLQLPVTARDALLEGKITEGHARSILALKDKPELQDELLALIQKNSWSVRQAEQFVVAAKADVATTERAKKRTDTTTPETKKLTQLLGRPVSVNHMAKGGRLVIRFKTDDDLGELVELLSSIGSS